MATSPDYATDQPARSDIDALTGPVVVEFGTNWCGICKAARPMIDQVLAAYPEVRHIRVEDGSGRKLGRSFAVKLWPTLVFLQDGKEVARLVRPGDTNALEQALARLNR